MIGRSETRQRAPVNRVTQSDSLYIVSTHTHRVHAVTGMIGRSETRQRAPVNRVTQSDSLYIVSTTHRVLTDVHWHYFCVVKS